MQLTIAVIHSVCCLHVLNLPTEPHALVITLKFNNFLNKFLAPMLLTSSNSVICRTSYRSLSILSVAFIITNCSLHSKALLTSSSLSSSSPLWQLSLVASSSWASITWYCILSARFLGVLWLVSSGGLAHLVAAAVSLSGSLDSAKGMTAWERDAPAQIIVIVRGTMVTRYRSCILERRIIISSVLACVKIFISCAFVYASKYLGFLSNCWIFLMLKGKTSILCM